VKWRVRSYVWPSSWMGLIFQSKFSAIPTIISVSSSLSSSEARLASASAYLLLSGRSFVAAIIKTAMGKDGISMSSFWDCSFIDPKRMASSIRFWALSKMGLYSGLSRSAISIPRVFM